MCTSGRPRPFALALLAAALLAGAAAAQSPAPAATVGKKYAVLVGVNRYDHSKFSPLCYPENDVTELAGLLRAAGYQVTLLTPGEGQADATLLPTRANIDKHLKTVLAVCKRGDTVLVALAGHGLQFAGVSDSFFCPQDAVPSATAEGRKTLLSLQGLYDRLDDSGAGVKLLLVDACRDDPRSGASRGVNSDVAPRPPRGVAALFSCSGGERAFESDKYRHGVFFYHLLEGLRGKARDRDDEVTWDSLAAYVRKQVSRDVPVVIGDGARQTPELSAGELAGEPPVLTGRTQTAARLTTLAVSFGDPTRQMAEPTGLPPTSRAAVLYVVPGGGGDRMGLRRGDFVLRVNGRDVNDSSRVLAALRPVSVGERVEFVVQRGKDRLTLAGPIETLFSPSEYLRRVREQAEQDTAAQHYLGYVYSTGQHVAKDEAEAVKWYRKAAEQGAAQGQHNLAWMYAAGRGVARDDAEAVKWYRKAANQGHAAARSELGFMYATGRGVTRDDVEAVKWFRNAADQGQAAAQNNLALMYENGRGVAKDMDEAVKWYRKAAAQNLDLAKKALQRLKVDL